MSRFANIDHRTLLTTAAIGVGTCAACCMVYRLWTGKCPCKCLQWSLGSWFSCGGKKAADTDSVYETQKSVNEYLVFHYGSSEEILSYDFGPIGSLFFPERCVDLCSQYMNTSDVTSIPSRALDIGCAVGRSTFELTRYFDETIGIDYSQSFIDTCNKLKNGGKVLYSVTRVGELTKDLEAVLDNKLDCSKASFQQGDACNLPTDLGQFSCVLAANLICRLKTPKTFFASLANLVAPGGIAVITSPYSFTNEFTPRANWIGGFVAPDGKQITGFDGVQACMKDAFDFVAEEDMPFFIRETERKNQWTVAHATVWRRKAHE